MISSAADRGVAHEEDLVHSPEAKTTGRSAGVKKYCLEIRDALTEVVNGPMYVRISKQ